MNYVNSEKNKKAFFDSMKKGNTIKFSKEKQQEKGFKFRKNLIDKNKQ